MVTATDGIAAAARHALPAWRCPKPSLASWPSRIRLPRRQDVGGIRERRRVDCVGRAARSRAPACRRSGAASWARRSMGFSASTRSRTPAAIPRRRRSTRRGRGAPARPRAGRGRPRRRRGPSSVQRGRGSAKGRRRPRRSFQREPAGPAGAGGDAEDARDPRRARRGRGRSWRASIQGRSTLRGRWAGRRRRRDRDARGARRPRARRPAWGSSRPRRRWRTR